MGILQVITSVLLCIVSILIATKKVPISISFTLCTSIALAMMLLGDGLERLL